MICSNCIAQPDTTSTVRHKYCVNNWGIDPRDDSVLVQRPEPIKACACQHKQSWNFAKSGDTEKSEGNNGNGS